MERRTLLGAMATAGCALAAGCAGVATRARVEGAGAPALDPVETLMRAHGVLDRLLLVSDEVVHRINGRRPAPTSEPGSAADLVRRFVEDHHERLAEDHVFP
ncbi:MAG: hypothetical protein IT294_15415 [Deltaproteobacteria bacterium]|nr:hypothetical protein [Deltaproteobacteria bacterium]